MEQINHTSSGEPPAPKPQLPVQEPANDSEENRFLRRLGQVVKQFPAKSVMLVIATFSALASAGWKTALLLHPDPAKPELEAARAAVVAAFPIHKLDTPKEPNVAVLINTLSNNLGPKVDVPEAEDPATNISGHWHYKCTALDRKYSHGGEATIDTQMTPYGPQWRLTGIRQWRETDGKREEGINYSWSTDWAAFTEKDRIKYTYHIATDKGTIIGFADGYIAERRNGIPIRIEGSFYQLPPLDPMYGDYELTRE